MKKNDLTTPLKKLLIDIVTADVLPKDCYLAGGTAVYLYLHHRLSHDLDFFSGHALHPEIFLSRLKNHFHETEVEILENDTIILYASKERIKVSLFYYPYPLLDNLYFEKINSSIECPLASRSDIMAMKTIAIVQRGSIKDFIDLYYLLNTTKLSFNKVVGLVKKKYGVEDRYEYQIKTAITYFDDADQEMSDICLINNIGNTEKISVSFWNDVKNFFISFAEPVK